MWQKMAGVSVLFVIIKSYYGKSAIGIGRRGKEHLAHWLPGAGHLRIKNKPCEAYLFFRENFYVYTVHRITHPADHF
jgi:hypothetical protein